MEASRRRTQGRRVAVLAVASVAACAMVTEARVVEAAAQAQLAASVGNVRAPARRQQRRRRVLARSDGVSGREAEELELLADAMRAAAGRLLDDEPASAVARSLLAWSARLEGARVTRPRRRPEGIVVDLAAARRFSRGDDADVEAVRL